MTAAGSYDELEFELALTGVLEDIYDLRVRSDRDLLNRRKQGYSTLEFRYQYDSGSSHVKVVVSIQGEAGSSFILHADFSDADKIAESAEQCEELALAMRTHQESRRPEDEAGPGRRWDD